MWLPRRSRNRAICLPRTNFPKPVLLKTAGYQPATVRAEGQAHVTILRSRDHCSELSGFYVPYHGIIFRPGGPGEPLAVHTETDRLVPQGRILRQNLASLIIQSQKQNVRGAPDRNPFSIRTEHCLT